jgi:hypothetical protein
MEETEMPGENVVKGAFFGLVATVPMTVVMRLFQRSAGQPATETPAVFGHIHAVSSFR